MRYICLETTQNYSSHILKKKLKDKKSRIVKGCYFQTENFEKVKTLAKFIKDYSNSYGINIITVAIVVYLLCCYFNRYYRPIDPAYITYTVG